MSFTRRPRRLGALTLTSVLIAGLLSFVPGVSALGSPAPSGPAYIDPPVLSAEGLTSALVHVRPHASLTEGVAAARAAGAQIGTRYDSIKVFVAYGRAGTFRDIARSSVIEAIEANSRLKHFTSTSHKATRGQDVLDGAVKMPDGKIINGSGVGVAVIDSGVDGTHPDLADRMGGNVKIVCTTPQAVALGATGGFTQCLGPKTAVPLADTDTVSAGGHGTHVAGTVAGTGAASAGNYHGAAPGATLYGVSVGTLISVENGLDGLDWVLQNHDQVTPAIKVVNNSWGSSYAKYDPKNAPFHKATWKLQEALIAEGVTVVFAAGNASGNGNTPTTTAECVNPTPGLVCVANYDDKNTGTRAGTIDPSSSRGKKDPFAAADQAQFPHTMTWPDVSAPGTGIVATCRLTLPVCNAHLGMITNPPNLYSTLSGTSMAAPHVAGIIAQLYQADPTLTPAEIENVIEDTAHKFAWGAAYGLHTDTTNPDDTSSFEKGHGLVDAVAALQAVMGGGVDPDPTTTPTSTPTPTPTPTPSASGSPGTGTGTTYYFHSGSPVGNVDRAPVSSPPYFDTKLPTWAGASTFHDLPAHNGSPQAVYDPNWTGSVGQRIKRLDLKFWQRSPVGDALGEVNYMVSVWVGATQYTLPTLNMVVPKTVDDGGSIVEGTFTTMLNSAGAQVPLDIDPAGQPVTITISGMYADEEGGNYILYDSVSEPSSFTVNKGIGTQPTGSPSATPTATVSPTPTPTPTATEEPPTARGTFSENPDDPYFDLQWNMDKINAPQAWQERRATGYGITIAIADSGLDLGHPDFACPGKVNLLPGSDVGDGDNDPSPVDKASDGHGTHVAGIAGACTNNGKGVVGVAPEATIMPIRALGKRDLDISMAESVRFATDNGAHVINMSIGDIPPFSHLGPDGYPETEEALEYARSKGVVIAAAAGNFSQPTCEYPSLSRNVICVVATDKNDERTDYSDLAINVDRNADEPGLEPVVAAPGGSGFKGQGEWFLTDDCTLDIISTTWRGADHGVCSPEKGYDYMQGTSMSSPHVAGIAALLYDRLGGVRSRANADLIVKTIVETAEDLYTPGYDPLVGYGRVDAARAVRAIQAQSPTTLTLTDSSASAGQFSDDATFQAVLRDEDYDVPVDGREVHFELSGAGGTAKWKTLTDAEGKATIVKNLRLEPGSYQLTARFLEDRDNFKGSADTASFVIAKEDTDTMLSVEDGERRVLTAVVADRDDHQQTLAGRTVEFFADGTSIGTAATDETGTAQLEALSPYDSGRHSYTASFAGDNRYSPSTSAPVDSGLRSTTLSFTESSATTAQFGDQAVFEAVLVDQAGAPMAARNVTFELVSGETVEAWTVTTDANGLATRSVTVDEAAGGSYQVIARFAGEEGVYGGSADSSTFVVSKEDTKLGVAVAGKNKTRTMTATLTESDSGAPLAGRTVLFFIDGARVGSATTGEDGVARINAPGSKGTRFEARFEGDNNYEASSNPS